MTIVADMGPLYYLILIGAEHILPRLFSRVLTATAVITEMSHPDTPEQVRRWAASSPQWLEIKEPAHIEDIPSLGRKGLRGAGEKAVIALAREENADAVLLDDKAARKEARKRELEPLWILQLLEEAAEQGLITDLPQKLDNLERKTTFYVSQNCKRILEDMKQRDFECKQKSEQSGASRPRPSSS